MKKEQKTLMKKIPAICKAAQYELSTYGKKVVMNNPNATRNAINQLIAEELMQLVTSINSSKIDALHKEAEAALIKDGRWRGNTTTVSNDAKPGAKTTPGWGSAPHGGSRGPTGYSQFQKQYRPILKAANPDKSGRDISSELGSAWRKMKLHFPNYIGRYNSSIDSNPEDDELANAMKKIVLVEKTHEKNLKKRRAVELRAPRHPPVAKIPRKSRDFSKLFNGCSLQATPIPQEEEDQPIAEGWGAEAAQAELKEEELNLYEEDDTGEVVVCSPTNPGFMVQKRRKACIPYLETRVKTTAVERGPIPTALCSIDHHIKESMAYCKAARVKVHEHSDGYTVAGKTSLYLTKTFYAAINQPTTTMEIVDSQDTLTPSPVTLLRSQPSITIALLCLAAVLPCLRLSGPLPSARLAFLATTMTSAEFGRPPHHHHRTSQPNPI